MAILNASILRQTEVNVSHWKMKWKCLFLCLETALINSNKLLTSLETSLQFKHLPRQGED